MLREKLVIFALDSKLDWATVTLVLTSGPKFLQFVAHDFGMKQEMCPKILILGFGHSQRSTLLKSGSYLNRLLLERIRQFILTHTPKLAIIERLSDILRLTFTQIKVSITFSVLISALALDVQLAKFIVFGLCNSQN